MTTREPRWTDLDRAYVRALLEYRADTCKSCGHQMSECQDPKTAGSWQVLTHVCEPSRVVEATLDNARSEDRKQRGVMYATRRYLGG